MLDAITGFNDDIPEDQPPKHPHSFGCKNIQATFLHVCTNQPTCAIPHLPHHDIWVAPMRRSAMPPKSRANQNLTCDSNLIDVQTEVDCTTSNSRKTVGQLLPGLTIKHLLESFDQPSRSDILSLTPWPICFPLSSPIKPGNETVCEVLIVSKYNFFGDMDVNTKSGCHRQDSPSDCHALQKE